MRRTPQTPIDQTLNVDLDGGFVGVNDKLEPALLPPGLVAAAMNCRFDASSARTREGTLAAIHLNPAAWQLFGGDPIRLYGAGTFSDPVGWEWQAVCGSGQMWLLADGANPRTIAFPAGEVLTKEVEIVQAFGNLLILRGTELEPWFWTGDQNTPLFKVGDPPPDLVDPERPRYLSAVPWSDFGIVVGGRLWVPDGRDELVWSDLQDYNAFDLTLNRVRLNAGEDDQIVAAIGYEESILVWKDQSIFRLNGVIGDPSQSLAVEQLNRGIGCLARRSVAQVGAEVFWLAQGGVYRLSQAFESRMTSSPVPLSDPIANTIRRINWSHAAGACGVVVDRYYYLAVPLDDATTNNAILVYDTVMGQWQGIDTIGNVQGVFRFLRGDLFGRRVPMIVSLSPVVGDPMLIPPPAIIAMEQGKIDRGLDGVERDIKFSLTTRGYALGELGIKKLRGVSLAWGSWGSDIKFTVLGEGMGEERVILNWKAASRFAYTRHGVAPWVGQNTADNFSAPNRGDYSWICGDGTETRSGLPVFAEQHYFQGFPLRQEARWIAFRLESRKGSFALKSVAADGLGERNVMAARN